MSDLRTTDCLRKRRIWTHRCIAMTRVVATELEVTLKQRCMLLGAIHVLVHGMTGID